jgi:hypothetical protein
MWVIERRAYRLPRDRSLSFGTLVFRSNTTLDSANIRHPANSPIDCQTCSRMLSALTTRRTFRFGGMAEAREALATQKN